MWDLYVAKCLGQNGAVIKIPKIRTMRKNADLEFRSLAEKNGMSESLKIQNDPRIIPSRRFLRKYYIDELPQVFYNVFWKRNMTLVGERPKSIDYWSKYPEAYRKRSLKNKPGFLGVHKYDTDRPQIKVCRRYQAEKKLRPYWTDIKYGAVIIWNVLTGKAKGE